MTSFHTGGSARAVRNDERPLILGIVMLRKLRQLPATILGGNQMSILRHVLVAALVAITPLAANAGTFETLYAFSGGNNGGNPYGQLTYQHGTLYGILPGFAADVTYLGNVYSVKAANGNYKVVHTFQGGADGAAPTGLIFQDGIFYGTTAEGGGLGCIQGINQGCGTIFSIDAKSGVESVLYTFSQDPNSVATGPFAVLDQDGVIYGTTSFGGGSGKGSVFAFNPSTESFATLHGFTGGADGNDPNPQLLYENSLLYGATSYGGTGCALHLGGCGTIFTVNPATGVETVLYAFKYGKTGKIPYSNFIYHAGWLTGDTLIGGDRQSCRNGCGVNFKVKVATGRETVINTFANRGESYSGITLAQGAVYETLPYGGSGYGALAQLDLKSGQQTVLYTFTGGADGKYPQAPLTYHDGAFYGTTLGGANPGCFANEGCGTVFKFVP